MGSIGTTGEDDGTAALPLESVDGIDVLRPTGVMSLADTVALVESAIRDALRRKCGRLLVSWDGSPALVSPSIPTRHAVIRQWASTANGRVTMALVLPADFIDAERFGESVAANFGLTGKAFSDEEAAMAWLAQVEV